MMDRTTPNEAGRVEGNRGEAILPFQNRQDTLLKSLVQFYQDQRRRPTAKDIKAGKGRYSERTFRRVFGSLGDALSMADNFQTVRKYEATLKQDRQDRQRAFDARHCSRARKPKETDLSTPAPSPPLESPVSKLAKVPRPPTRKPNPCKQWEGIRTISAPTVRTFTCAYCHK